MKIKFLAILSLTVALFIGACNRNDSNANRTNLNVNMATPMGTATATPLVANTGPMMKSRIESELRAKGLNNITIDVTTTPATIRGTYPKGKLAEVIQAAQVANGGKPVKNEATEEK